MKRLRDEVCDRSVEVKRLYWGVRIVTLNAFAAVSGRHRFDRRGPAPVDSVRLARALLSASALGRARTVMAARERTPRDMKVATIARTRVIHGMDAGRPATRWFWRK